VRPALAVGGAMGLDLSALDIPWNGLPNKGLYGTIFNGKVAEWFNASVLKTDVAVRLPRVRLPLFPIIRLDVNRML
jgi:hypothetical protein